MYKLANYGIGGQYEPHYDHATEYDVGDFGEVDGNRIGTWLSYMSEPKYGGGTIFMEPVAIRAEPIKVSIKSIFTRNNFCEGERRLLVQSNAIRSLGLPNTTRGMSSGGRREMGFQHLAARTGRRIHTTMHTWQFKHHLGFYLLIQYM